LIIFTPLYQNNPFSSEKFLPKGYRLKLFSPSVKAYWKNLHYAIRLAMRYNFDLLIIEDDIILNRKIPIKKWRSLNCVIAGLYRLLPSHTGLDQPVFAHRVKAHKWGSTWRWRWIVEEDLIRGRWLPVDYVGFGLVYIPYEALTLNFEERNCIDADSQLSEVWRKYGYMMLVDTHYYAYHYDRKTKLIV